MFYEWAINNGYAENLTIDRIDNDGPYSPRNCRWTTRLEQNNNKRNNYYIEYNGERHTLAQWSRILNVSGNVLRMRKYRGWSDKEIIEGKQKHS